MARALSNVMRAALDAASEHGSLEYWRGGWWTYPGCPVLRETPDGYRVPAWAVGVGTIHALVGRKLLEVSERSDRGYVVRVKPSEVRA